MTRSRLSAGLLLFRRGAHGLEVLLVHPGGPFWRNKDVGAWTIPKGEVAADETAEAAAVREFEEETGLHPGGPRLALGEVRQKGGKTVACWAVEGDARVDDLHSNEVTLEWPPRSGRRASFPEVDRYAWLDPAVARRKINAAQAELIDRLEARLSRPA